MALMSYCNIELFGFINQSDSLLHQAADTQNNPDMVVIINPVTHVHVLTCRSHAIACVNQFIVGRSQALMSHIDSFIEVLCYT